jgi:hypothetical protein
MAGPDAKKPAAATPPARPAQDTPFPTGSYLFLYNLASSIAWGTVLARTLTHAARYGTGEVYPAVGHFVRLTQTAACLEILHSLLGKLVHAISIPLQRPIPSPPSISNMLQQRGALTISTVSNPQIKKQASSAPPSSRPSCKSPPASSSSGA